MRIALAQINSTVGDLAGNEAKILEGMRWAETEKADVVLFPELTTTGYPPRDLLLKKQFVEQNLAVIDRVAAASGRAAAIIGYVGRNQGGPGREVTNAAAIVQQGKILATRVKTLLPTYDVFDEDRYFEPARENPPLRIGAANCGISICEDIWNDEDFWPQRRYQANPVASLIQSGVECLFNISASPWSLGKDQIRRDMLSTLATKAGVPVALCNLVGGDDELIFDGGSLLFNGKGELIAQAKLFAEDFVVADTETAQPIAYFKASDEENVYHALVLGLRDYFLKCGFRSAILGLSGGIDSAVVACLAVAALGAENVYGVALPSRFSSPGSLADAAALAKNLGIRHEVISIEPPFAAVLGQLQPAFTGLAENATEENIQARLRGVTLMALSNKFGSLLLTTGNKSELAVGYCTLYGDMCGGLAVISDVPKTMVYRLARWINRRGEIIPKSSLEKPPSAELRLDQTDQDSLPPYEILDAILDHYVVQGRSAAEIVQLGFPLETVRRVIHLIDSNEYKRRQAAPGLKVTGKAFGVGRRYPIAQRYRET